MPKFKVHLQQYVEKTATIEVDADDAGMAVQIAQRDGSSVEWTDGDDAYAVSLYAVHNEDGTLAWER